MFNSSTLSVANLKLFHISKGSPLWPVLQGIGRSPTNKGNHSTSFYHPTSNISHQISRNIACTDGPHRNWRAGAWLVLSNPEPNGSCMLFYIKTSSTATFHERNNHLKSSEYPPMTFPVRKSPHFSVAFQLTEFPSPPEVWTFPDSHHPHRPRPPRGLVPHVPHWIVGELDDVGCSHVIWCNMM